MRCRHLRLLILKLSLPLSLSHTQTHTQTHAQTHRHTDTQTHACGFISLSTLSLSLLPLSLSLSFSFYLTLTPAARYPLSNEQELLLFRESNEKARVPEDDEAKQANMPQLN